MANETPNPGPGPETGAAAAPPGPQVMSLEDLDTFLSQEDPEFTKSLENIRDGAAELNTASIEPLENIDEKQLEEQDDAEEKKKRLENRLKKLKFLLLFWGWLKVKAARLYIKMINISVWTWHTVLRFFYINVPQYYAVSKTNLTKGWTAVAKSVAKVNDLSPLKKIVLVLGISFICSTYFLARKTLSGGWWPKIYNPLVTDLEAEADTTTPFNVRKDFVDFYQSFPQPEFIVQLNKVVVNFKRTNPIENPMGVFEFYMSVDAQDTAIEVKDREREMLDLIQRELETMTYPEALGLEGKARIKNLARKAVNQALNQGRVEKVFFRNIITKP